MEFVRIPAGEFQMGCSPGDTECRPDEKPAHRVRITKAFEMGKHEVTQAQWEVVMGTNPSYVKEADRPVDTVSWDDAQEFLKRMNARQDGYRYRLPTEAEWEYAARAGSSEKHTGPADAVAGQKQANGWGLNDMPGSLSEWCQDFYDENYYKSSPARDPQGPPSGLSRVLRGFPSSIIEAEGIVLVSHRVRDAPDFRTNGIGFRCVRERN
jgi:formylglycine-generating enzyme required for sulfatase activity